MISTQDKCHLCEKIILNLEGSRELMIHEVPNTYDVHEKKFTWKHQEAFSYALIPEEVREKLARVSYFLCIDEDLMDDIDVRGYAEKFFRENILPQWKSIVNVYAIDPVLERPRDIECWKLKHESFMEEE